MREVRRCCVTVQHCGGLSQETMRSVLFETLYSNVPRCCVCVLCSVIFQCLSIDTYLFLLCCTGKDDSVVRQKLLMLLKSSEHVTAESVVTSFPNDGGCMGWNELIGCDFHFQFSTHMVLVTINLHYSANLPYSSMQNVGSKVTVGRESSEKPSWWLYRYLTNNLQIR